MGNDVLYRVMKNLKTKPHLRRKLKIFLAVGVGGFILTSALVIWAGFSTINYMANKTDEIMKSPLAKAQFESLKSEAQALPKLNALSCWGKVQSLMAVVPWLERPALENLIGLKVACLEKSEKSFDVPIEGENI